MFFNILNFSYFRSYFLFEPLLERCFLIGQIPDGAAERPIRESDWLK